MNEATARGKLSETPGEESGLPNSEVDTLKWWQERLAETTRIRPTYKTPPPGARYSKLGFNMPPPQDWLWKPNPVIERTGLAVSGGWLFTVFAPQPKGDQSMSQWTRMEVFYLPVQGARKMTEHQLTDFLALILEQKIRSTASLGEHVRVTTHATLPRELTRQGSGYYAISLDIKSGENWYEHWVVIQAGHNIIYFLFGVPAQNQARSQELSSLIESAILDDDISPTSPTTPAGSGLQNEGNENAP